MGIVMTTSKEDLSRYFAERLRRINTALIMELQNAGEQCVNHAREVGSGNGFSDQTGNLRSSIGYVIYINGRPYTSSGFKQVTGPKGNNGEGSATGEKLADKLASKYRKGICLVVVAGMNYAYYVESKNRDVLSSAEHLADKLIPDLLKQLSKNASKI